MDHHAQLLQFFCKSKTILRSKVYLKKKKKARGSRITTLKPAWAVIKTQSQNQNTNKRATVCLKLHCACLTSERLWVQSLKKASVGLAREDGLLGTGPRASEQRWEGSGRQTVGTRGKSIQSVTWS
jgi:hypothetical protein